MARTGRAAPRPVSGDPPPGPLRTCIGCRRIEHRSALLRIVVGEDQGRLILLPDPARRLPGRGASLHPDEHCLATALLRRAFARALRVSAPLDPALVLAFVEERAPENALPSTKPKAGHRDEQPMSTQR